MIESKYPVCVFSSVKTCAFFAFEVSSVVKGKIPDDVDVMVELSARWTVVSVVAFDPSKISL